MKYFFDFRISTFPTDVKLRLELKQKQCNLILSSVLEFVECRDWEHDATRYISTRNLLITNPEMESNVDYIKGPAAMDVWLGELS